MLGCGLDTRDATVNKKNIVHLERGLNEQCSEVNSIRACNEEPCIVCEDKRGNF